MILATEVVAVLATPISWRRSTPPPHRPEPLGWALQVDGLAVVHRPVRQLRREHRRGRGKARAADATSSAPPAIALRMMKDPQLIIDQTRARRAPHRPAYKLAAGNVVLVETGDMVPSDGEIIEGVASVNEAAITGESAPVIRESGGDRSAVTGGTTVVSDWIKVRITAEPGNTFLDRMIAMVEGAERRKTPNELALTVLLAGLTLIFLIAVATLLGLGKYSGVRFAGPPGAGRPVHLHSFRRPSAALLSAIGIAGMDRLLKVNVLATSGRAVEASGDVDTLLLDKTGTITHGNRMATEVIPAARRAPRARASGRPF